MMRKKWAKRILAASKTGLYLARGEYEWQDCPILGGRRLLVIGNAQVVQIDGVGRLLVVSVQLEVYDYAIPSHRGERRIGGVDCTADAVESDCLIHQIV
jgi:hypothetical protein